MATSSVVLTHFHHPKCRDNQTLASTPWQFRSYDKPRLGLERQIYPTSFPCRGLRCRRQSRRVPVIFAAQSNYMRVLRTAWKVGKDAVEAGTNLVPNSVPRPMARISVTLVALAASLFVLKSVLSTAFFVLATMGLAYFIFIALNKDEGPRSGGGGGGSTMTTEDSLTEARRIMEKYK